MADESTPVWDEMYEARKGNPLYPSEDVIRFLASPVVLGAGGGSLLDIGCGPGRHLQLAAEWGWEAVGVDSSPEAVAQAGERRGRVHQADIAKLPFEDETFDAALAFAVFAYADDPAAAIAEMRRILKPGGWAFVTFRTLEDWRYGLGEPIAVNRFRLRLPGDAEDGLACWFASAAQISLLFEPFGLLNLELAETTTWQRTRRNSEWLATVRR